MEQAKEGSAGYRAAARNGSSLAGPGSRKDPRAALSQRGACFMPPYGSLEAIGVGRICTFEEAIVVGVSGGRNRSGRNNKVCERRQQAEEIFHSCRRAAAELDETAPHGIRPGRRE